MTLVESLHAERVLLRFQEFLLFFSEPRDLFLILLHVIRKYFGFELFILDLPFQHFYFASQLLILLSQSYSQSYVLPLAFFGAVLIVIDGIFFTLFDRLAIICFDVFSSKMLHYEFHFFVVLMERDQRFELRAGRMFLWVFLDHQIQNNNSYLSMSRSNYDYS